VILFFGVLHMSEVAWLYAVPAILLCLYTMWKRGGRRSLVLEDGKLCGNKLGGGQRDSGRN